ncbi:hypothetical protein NHF45_06500 [Maricaulaceae bacterium NA33B04]|nr:hypothetical protein [Maricaulaceae bacterium NA33B04]
MISAILATSIIGAVGLLGNGVDGMWDNISASLSRPLVGGGADAPADGGAAPA